MGKLSIPRCFQSLWIRIKPANERFEVHRCPRASTIWKYLTILLLILGKRWGPDYAGVWVTRFFVIKLGETYRLSEADAMHYVRTHTSIPVRKVYAAFTWGTRTYIMMSREKGKTVIRAWNLLDDQQKAALFQLLRQCWAELRLLSPPLPGAVGNVNYGLINDQRVRGGGHGPYESVDELQKFVGTLFVLRKTIKASPTSEDGALASKMIATTWDTRFTHGDLSSSNILIHEDGTLSSIIDWEMSGWLPEYYEYSSAWHCNFNDQHFWRQELDRILEPYPQALQMEKWRRRKFPCY